MTDIILILGSVGWLIGAVCLFGFLYQRGVNRDRDRREAAERQASRAKKSDPGS